MLLLFVRRYIAGKLDNAILTKYVIILLGKLRRTTGYLYIALHIKNDETMESRAPLNIDCD